MIHFQRTFHVYLIDPPSQDQKTHPPFHISHPPPAPNSPPHRSHPLPHPTMSPPPSVKYDRQIRLWGDHGQAALSQASICLINASATGAETLKNLVLPGIASFTIVDGSRITDVDRGNNLFLSSNGLRAVATVDAINELNRDVDGSYIAQHPHMFLTSVHAAQLFLKRFSVVILTQMPQDDVFRYISDACYALSIPLIVVRSVGFMGYLRIQCPNLYVQDSKEEGLIPDLRLFKPFPALREYIDSIHLNDIQDTQQLSHIPSLVIAAKALDIYRERHSKLPTLARAERLQFEAIIASLRPPKCPADAQNFAQAKSMQRCCFQAAAEIPKLVGRVLRDERSNPESEVGFVIKPVDTPNGTYTLPEVSWVSKPENHPSPDGEGVPGVDVVRTEGVHAINKYAIWFWVHASGVRKFVEVHDMLPLSASLPDMETDTDSYIFLQKMYSKQAAEESAECLGYSQKAARQYAVEVQLDEQSMRDFCRRIRYITVVSTRSIAQEMECGKDGGFREKAEMEGALDPSETGFASPYYVMLRASDMLHREHGRCAGSTEEMRESDQQLMKEYADIVKEEVGIVGGKSLWRDYEQEMVRFADSEMHNVAAFMGGVAAQEVTKILTHQFLPMADSMVLNFAQQCSIVFPA